MIMCEKQGKTCEIWYHGLCEDFKSKIKENKKMNLTRLETETDRYVQNIVFATTLFST